MSAIMQKLGLPAHGRLTMTVPQLEEYLKTHRIHGITKAMIDKNDGFNLHLDVNNDFGITKIQKPSL